VCLHDKEYVKPLVMKHEKEETASGKPKVVKPTVTPKEK